MQFIHGSNDISRIIESILAGKNGIYIVAYIGSGVTKLINKQSKARIICDAEKYSSCDPKEIHELMKKKHKVKKFKNLHAKVFVSDKGAFIGSKNMTTAGSFEAGIYLHNKTEEFVKIREWATEFFKKNGETIEKNELSSLIIKREMLDLERSFYGNKPSKKKNWEEEKFFSAITDFGGIAYWEDALTARPADVRIEAKKDDVRTVREWYKKFGLNNDHVFQDDDDHNKYPNIVRNILQKKFISVEVDLTRKEKPIKKTIGIISPFVFEKFRGSSGKEYYLTGYKDKKARLNTKKLNELLNGIWTSKPPLKSFKKWEKTDLYQFLLMDAKTIEQCTEEYLSRKK